MAARGEHQPSRAGPALASLRGRDRLARCRGHHGSTRDDSGGGGTRRARPGCLGVATGAGHAPHRNRSLRGRAQTERRAVVYSTDPARRSLGSSAHHRGWARACAARILRGTHREGAGAGHHGRRDARAVGRPHDRGEGRQGDRPLGEVSAPRRRRSAAVGDRAPADALSRQRTAATAAAIRSRPAASGITPSPAFMFSTRCSGRLVAGITDVTAG